jgi:hypothetical protein
MKLIEVKCTNCTKEIYIYEEHVKKNIFCTLGCMNSYKAPVSIYDTTLHD